MKNYEVEIKQIENDLKNERRTVENYDNDCKDRYLPRSMRIAMLESRTDLSEKIHILQIMKSKQILFNMQNGAR